jgi:hypothetical protein
MSAGAAPDEETECERLFVHLRPEPVFGDDGYVHYVCPRCSHTLWIEREADVSYDRWPLLVGEAAGGATPAEQLIRLILDLRVALKATRESETAARLRRVESNLRQLLGPSVAKAPAARLLGASATTLDRWIERGRLPVVANARSPRLAVETRPLLDLAEEVERLHRQGVKRSRLAQAFENLGWPDDPEGRRVLREEIAALPRSNVPVLQLRRDYERTTPEERVLQLAALSRSLTRFVRDGADSRKRGRDEPLDIRSILEVLTRHAVYFIATGAVAVAYHGYVHATNDVDVLPAPTDENRRKLCAALLELEARPVELPGAVDLESPVHGARSAFATKFGRLDVIDAMTDRPLESDDYQRLRGRSEHARHDFGTFAVACLADLEHMKRVAGREQDLIDIRSIAEAQGIAGPIGPHSRLSMLSS